MGSLASMTFKCVLPRLLVIKDCFCVLTILVYLTSNSVCRLQLAHYQNLVAVALEVSDVLMVNVIRTVKIKMLQTAKANKWFNVQEHLNVLNHMKLAQLLYTAL